MRMLLLAIVVLTLVATASAGGKRSIAIVDASQSSGVVTVEVKISGWKMYPALVGKRTNKRDGGHWHIYIDGKYNAYSANATTGRTTRLSTGKHTLYVELANNDHSSLSPRVRSGAISVNVGREPPPPGTEPPPTSDPGYGTDPYGP